MKLSDDLTNRMNAALSVAIMSNTPVQQAAALCIGYLARRLAGASGKRVTAENLRKLALEIERA